MAIYFVRHAKAGDRRVWTGEDIDRPLSKTGWAQSHALATRLLKHDPSILLSSPYVRCVQTLEPLAELSGLEVKIETRICEY
jgi:broad specificity phosphatase PhoE